MTHEVVVTGCGLLCAAGETANEIWDVLAAPGALTARVDSEAWPPFHIYPVPGYDLAAQVPKKSDQRAMGPAMQYGAYACGLALDAARVKGDEAVLSRLELIGVSDGGERDWEVDGRVLELLDRDSQAGAELNRILSDDLRPTLFLAQLPNLFGGNMSIIHGVAGATRTFMGEESASVDAFRIGFERIAAGQGDIFAVGGAFNADRPDLHAMYDAGGLLLAGPLTDLWERPDAGICLGSAGAFLVMESAEHAEARGIEPLARVVAVSSDRGGRDPGAAAARAGRQLKRVRARLRTGRLAVMSGASGRGSVTREEQEFLEGVAESGLDCAVRGTAGALGHSMGAAFFVNAILGVICLRRNAVFPPLAPGSALESRLAEAPVDQALITGWGAVRGEGMALFEAI